MKTVKRGEIFYADLTPVKGSEQGGVRPVIIIQNDIGNKYSPTTIVGVFTSQIDKTSLPTHIFFGKQFGLTDESLALFEQIRTIDKIRLKEKIGEITDPFLMSQVDKALHISLGLS